jgi:hypothetical protein
MKAFFMHRSLAARQARTIKPAPFAVMLLAVKVCLAAIPATTVWEVRTTGSDTNGGGFDGTASPSVDYSQNNNKNAAGCSNCGSSSANLSTTDALITSASSTVTSATASFSSALTGNLIYLSGGTCTTGSLAAQWRRAAFSNSTTITLDQAPSGTFTGTCTGVTMNVGGAMASPSVVAANKVAGNDVYIKSGTYTISSTSATVSNGVVLESTGGVNASNTSIWWGYGSTRGDDGAKPLLQASGIATASLFKVTGSHVTLRNLSLDGAGLTGIKCVEQTSGSYGKYIRLKASNCTNKAFDLTIANLGWAVSLEATGCSTASGVITLGGSTGGVLGYNIEAHDNTATGILINGTGFCSNCLSYRNTGASSDGFDFPSGPGGTLLNSVAAYNGRYGVNITSSRGIATLVANTIAYGNATGFATDQVQDGAYVFNSASGGNTSSNYNSAQLIHLMNHVALTSDPFTNAGSSANGAADFSLNTAAGGGAALRTAGFSGYSPSGNSRGYGDIGAIQHADSAGGGSTVLKSFTFLQ